jgi:Mce-associated membrane protein
MADDTSDAAALAEAEAVEAEALAEAARARARALRLRQQADSIAEAGQPDTGPAGTGPAVTGETEPRQVDSGQTGETDAADEQPPSQRRLRRSRWAAALTTAGLALVFALLGVSGYIVVRHDNAVQHQQRAAAFAAAARQGVINMTTLNFEHAEDDIQRLLDDSTGEFKDDFGKQADDFIKVAKQTRAVSDGTVNSAAVESMDKDSAVVLVAATSHVSNAAGADEDPREWRLRVTVARTAIRSRCRSWCMCHDSRRRRCRAKR